jgi:hypothetical protein
MARMLGWRGALAGLLTALMVGTLWVMPASADEVSSPLRAAVASLPVAAENRTGYSRSLFKLWVDADHNGCNTRQEVLIAEAVTAPDVGTRCALTGGSWRSYYDGAVWGIAGELDIDHLVPLAEAWDSGASGWTSEQRQQYANDLGDERDLVAVTAGVNRAKGDQDPATWLPDADVCRYVGEWVAVKLRWRLSVDDAEKAALTERAAACPDVTIKVDRAI